MQKSTPDPPAVPYPDPYDSTDDNIDRISEIDPVFEAAAAARPIKNSLTPIAPMLEAARWDVIQSTLHDCERRSARLELISAVAEKETSQTASDDVDRRAIEAMARLLGVPKSHPAALVIAKRILRRRPSHVSTRPASKRSASLMTIGAVALVAVVIGFVTAGLGRRSEPAPKTSVHALTP